MPNGLMMNWRLTHTGGTCEGCHEGSCRAGMHCPCEGCGCPVSASPEAPHE